MSNLNLTPEAIEETERLRSMVSFMVPVKQTTQAISARGQTAKLAGSAFIAMLVTMNNSYGADYKVELADYPTLEKVYPCMPGQDAWVVKGTLLVKSIPLADGSCMDARANMASKRHDRSMELRAAMAAPGHAAPRKD